MLIAVCRYDTRVFIVIQNFDSTSFKIFVHGTYVDFVFSYSIQSMAILNNAEFLQSECKAKRHVFDRMFKRQAQEPGTFSGT